MDRTTRNRYRALAMFLGPAVLVAGLLYHPYIANLTDASAVAEAAVADPTRWGLSHLGVAIGAGTVALAFLALHGCLREAGEERWSFLAVPFVVLGGTLYAILPGMELGLIGAVETGSDVRASQAAIDPWFLPVMISAAILSATGMAAFAVSIVRSRVLDSLTTRVVVVGLVALALTRFVPLGAVQFYVQSGLLLIVFWPLAYQAAGGRLAERLGRPQPASA